MSPPLDTTAQKRRENLDQLYRAVRNANPEAYLRAVEIGNWPLIHSNEPGKAAARVEADCIYLIAQLLGLTKGENDAGDDSTRR
jgi:lysophospholipase L1-like esterase